MKEKVTRLQPGGINPALGMRGVRTPQYVLTAHKFKNITLFALTIKVLSYLFDGVVY